MSKRKQHSPEFKAKVADLPLNCHPVAIRASAVCVTPWGAGRAAGGDA